MPEPLIDRGAVVGEDRDGVHLAAGVRPLCSGCTVEGRVDGGGTFAGGAVAPFGDVGALAGGVAEMRDENGAEKADEFAGFQGGKGGAGG